MGPPAAVRVQLADNGPHAPVPLHGHVAEVWPVVDEVAVCEDGIRL